MMPNSIADVLGNGFDSPVEVDATTGDESPGVYATKGNPLDVQVPTYINLIVTTEGEGVGDITPIVMHIEGCGAKGIWNTGNPEPVYVPVFGDTATSSSFKVDVSHYQEIRVGKITNPNSGKVTVSVTGDYKC